MTLKHTVWRIIEPSDETESLLGRWSHRFDVAILTLIFLNVLAIILESVAALQARWGAAFDAFELFSVAVFTVEYGLRLWTATENPRYARPFSGRLRYALRPLLLIDLLAVLPAYLPILGVNLAFVRALRLMRVFRLVKIVRYTETLGLFGRVVRERRAELVVTTALVGLLLVLASSLMFYAERAAQPETFSSIPATMWWAVATLTTVGYGDVYPITAAGRVLAAVVAVLGIGLFALPTGILGAGFVEEIEKRRGRLAAPKALVAPEGAEAASGPGFRDRLARCPHCGGPVHEDEGP